jgi:hypothetical protein
MFAKRLLSLLAALSGVLALGAGARAEGPRSELLAVLKARAGSVQTFQAEVKVVTSQDGRDRQRYGKDRLRYLEWARQQQRTKAQLADLEKVAKYFLGPPPPAHTWGYRYYAQRSGELRIERLAFARGAAQPTDARPDVRVYRGDRWLLLGNNQTDLTVLQQHAESPFFEVARGEALFPGFVTRHHKARLSSRSLGIAQVPWGEVLQVFDADSATDLREPLPSGGPARPVLLVSDALVKDMGLRPCRVRLWFDPDQGHMPLRLEYQELEVHSVDGKPYYLTKAVAEWSEPAALPAGLVFPHKAVLSFYDRFAPSGKGDNPDKWPGQSYEVSRQTFTFSKVRVNEPLDPTLFAVKPPPGTNVTDEVSGYAYVVGSAGEELRKTALKAQELVPPPQPVRRGKTVWVVLAVNGLLLGSLALFYLRRWLSTGRKGTCAGL